MNEMRPAAASLPPATTLRTGLTADPFGLWLLAAEPGALQYGLPTAEPIPLPEGQPAAVWLLDLPASGGQAALDARAAQVRAVERGLAEAPARLEALLHARGLAAGWSFGVSAPVVSAEVPPVPGPEAAPSSKPEAAAGAAPVPKPEAELMAALDWLAQPSATAFSFGLGEWVDWVRDRITGLPRPDWEGLSERFADLVESLQRQVLHMAWIETCIEGRLVARTVAGWDGGLRTCYTDGLSAQYLDAHSRSCALALAARQANLRAVLTAVTLAGKILLATTTPLGAALTTVQALALAWQFIQGVVMPAGR